MKKLLLILTLALSMLMLVACGGGDGGQNAPPADNGGGDDKVEMVKDYLALIRADESISLGDILSAIYDKDGKMLSIMSDEYDAMKGEIVFGDANRDVTREAATLLDSLIEAGGGKNVSTGYVIYKDKIGNIAVYWNDSFGKSLALEKFLSDYASVSTLASFLPGTVCSDVFNIDEYIAATEWADIEANAPAEVVTALKSLNKYFDGPAIADWIANLWEPYLCVCGKCAEEGKEIACYGGAFYYANSARDYEGFLPDVESTSQALSLLNSLGAFSVQGGWANAIDDTMKEKLIVFCQQLQDKDSGYFYHPQWGSNIGAARRGRDLGWATGILDSLGAEPLYPTALDRLNGSAGSAAVITKRLGTSTADAISSVIPTASFESSLGSAEDYMKWLVEVTNGDNMFVNSSGAHTISSVSSQIIAAGYLEITLDYLDDKVEQLYTEMKAAYDADPINNPKPTGLWQRTADYNAVWGVLKLSGLYSSGNRPFKYHEDAMRTCIEVVLMDADEGGNYHMNDVWNQWASCKRVIANAKTHNPAIVEKLYAMAAEYAIPMIENTKAKLAKFIQDDGTYGYNQGTSAPTTQGTAVSLGMPEGDVNATALAYNTYADAFSVLGYNAVKLCDYRDGERVLETISSLASVEKIILSTTDPYDFDDMPVSVSTSVSSGGSVEIAPDPKNSSNSVLKFITLGTAGDTVNIRPSGSASASNCFIFEADYCLISKNREYLFQITMGESYMIDVLYKNGKLTFRDNATTANTSHTTPIDVSAALGEWVNLRIEYYKDDTNPTVKIYTNDRLVGISHNYYGSSNTDPAPANTYAMLKIYAMKAAEAELLIDNLYAGAENKEYVDEEVKEEEVTDTKTQKYDFEGATPAMPIVDSEKGLNMTAVKDSENASNSLLRVETSRDPDATYGNGLTFLLSNGSENVTTKGISFDMNIASKGDTDGNGVPGQLNGDYFTNDAFPVLYQFNFYSDSSALFRVAATAVADSAGIVTGYRLSISDGVNGKEEVDFTFRLDKTYSIKLEIGVSASGLGKIGIYVEGTKLLESSNYISGAKYSSKGDISLYLFALKRTRAVAYFDNIEYYCSTETVK